MGTLNDIVKGRVLVADSPKEANVNEKHDTKGDAAATGGGNAVTDAVRDLKRRVSDDIKANTPRSELREITLVLAEETEEVELEGTAANLGRGLKEASADENGEACGAAPKKRSLAPDVEGRPNLIHDESESTIAERKYAPPLAG